MKLIIGFLTFLFSACIVYGQTFDAKSFYKIYNDQGEVMNNGDAMDNMANIILSKEAKGIAGQLFSIKKTGNNEVFISLPAYEKALDYTSEAKENKLIIQWDGFDANIHQQWLLTELADGAYLISPKRFPNLALSYRKDGKVQLVQRNDKEASQKWFIRKTNEGLPKTLNAVGEEYWENEQIFAVNKEEDRNTFLPFLSMDEGWIIDIDTQSGKLVLQRMNYNLSRPFGRKIILENLYLKNFSYHPDKQRLAASCPRFSADASISLSESGVGRVDVCFNAALPDVLVKHYVLCVTGPDGKKQEVRFLARGYYGGFDFPYMEHINFRGCKSKGTYFFQIKAVSCFGKESEWLESNFTVK